MAPKDCLPLVDVVDIFLVVGDEVDQVVVDVVVDGLPENLGHQELGVLLGDAGREPVALVDHVVERGP